MTTNHLINYETLVKELTQYEECDRNIKKYDEIDRLELKFTLHGDYIGSTVEKSNYAVFTDRLESIPSSDRSENIRSIESGYSTKQYAIEGSITAVEYELVKSCLESVASYPLLDEEHYSQQEDDDCLESFESWQKDDILSELSRNYNVDPETVNSDRLLNILLELELETREENACSYWSSDDDNYQEIADRLAPELAEEGTTQCRW